MYEARDPVGTIAVPVDAPDAELLRAALEAGYFEVPRETSLAALAEEFDCAESTLSERLRRATRDILAEALRADESGPS
ncbi:MAG: helix-turn-helix domain-containing protein [Halococcoides sp.]